MARQRPEKVTGLIEEHGSYVVRMVVPKDVKAAFGKTEFRKNLQTSNRIIAAREAKSAVTEWKAMVARIRAGETPEAIQSVVDDWKAKQQRRGVRDGGDDLIRLLYLALSGSQASGVADVTNGLGLPDTEVAKLAVAKALVEVQQARIHNDRADDAVAVAQTAASTAMAYERETFGVAGTKPNLELTGYSLRQFYKVWASRRDIPAKRVVFEENYLAALTDFMGGDFDLAALDKMKVLEFWSALEWYPARRTAAMNERGFMAVVNENKRRKGTPDFREPLGASTLNNWHKFYNQMFNRAIQLDILTKNPFSAITIELENGGMTGTEMTPGELGRYFQHADFEKPWDDKGWLSVASLMTGCRINELRTAHGAEFIEIDGKPFFDLRNRSTDNADPRRVKNAQSKRLVPIHPTLEALGFLEWVRSKTDADRFPRSLDTYSRTTTERMTKLDIDNSFHGLRHTFSRCARTSGLTEEIKDLIMGQTSGGGIGRNYGRGVSPAKLYADMATVVFEGFPLDRVAGA